MKASHVSRLPARLLARMVRNGALLSVLTFLTVLGSCDAPTAVRPEAAYDPTQLTGGIRYRWTSGTTVRVWFANGAVVDGLDAGLAVRNAIQVWNASRQFGEFTLAMATDIHEANVVVFDRVLASPVMPGSCAFDPRGSAGYTYFCPGGGNNARAERLGLVAGGASLVSVIIRLDRGRVSSQPAYNAVVAHEFGHALGIGAHTDQATDLMFGLPTVQQPSARDIATLRSLLGRVADVRL